MFFWVHFFSKKQIPNRLNLFQDTVLTSPGCLVYYWLVSAKAAHQLDSQVQHSPGLELPCHCLCGNTSGPLLAVHCLHQVECGVLVTGTL